MPLDDDVVSADCELDVSSSEVEVEANLSERELAELENVVPTSPEDDSDATLLLDAIPDGEAVVTADAETKSVDIGVLCKDDGGRLITTIRSVLAAKVSNEIGQHIKFGPIYPIILVTLPVACIIAHAKAPGVGTTCTDAVFGTGFVGSQPHDALMKSLLDDVEVLMEDADSVESFGMAVDSDTFWLPVGNTDAIGDVESWDAESSVDIEDV
ncbi:hypothetical protein KC349_g213 [Hortaea werneckii]|nr:hypothetical protein KC349_g213 [Hortaea werneckii]